MCSSYGARSGTVSARQRIISRSPLSICFRPHPSLGTINEVRACPWAAKADTEQGRDHRGQWSPGSPGPLGCSWFTVENPTPAVPAGTRKAQAQEDSSQQPALSHLLIVTLSSGNEELVMGRENRTLPRGLGSVFLGCFSGFQQACFRPAHWGSSPGPGHLVSCSRQALPSCVLSGCRH